MRVKRKGRLQFNKTRERLNQESACYEIGMTDEGYTDSPPRFLTAKAKRKTHGATGFNVDQIKISQLLVCSRVERCRSIALIIKHPSR